MLIFSEIGHVSEKMMRLVTEQGLEQLEAWNQSSVQLTNSARVKTFS